MVRKEEGEKVVVRTRIEEEGDGESAYLATPVSLSSLVLMMMSIFQRLFIPHGQLEAKGNS